VELRAVGEGELAPLSELGGESEEAPEEPELAPVVEGGGDAGAVEEPELDPGTEAWVSEEPELEALRSEEEGLEGPPKRTRKKAPSDTEVEPTATGGSFGFLSLQSGVTERSVCETLPSIPPPKANPSMRRCSGIKRRNTAP
jgi:hypothetical protein